MIPDSLLYTKDHEWIKVDGDTATVGITDHAQSALGDITFVEPPELDSEVSAGDEVCSVESCKAAASIYTPVDGTIVGFNETLDESPEMVNQSPYEDGWIYKIAIADKSGLDELMDATAYTAFLAEEE